MSAVNRVGNSTSYTVTVSSDGVASSISNCTAQVLQDRDCKKSQDCVINATCQAHHSRYYSCTKTLFVMTELWLIEMNQLLRKGIPRRKIIKAFKQAVDLMQNNLQPVVLDLNTLFGTSEQHTAIAHHNVPENHEQAMSVKNVSPNPSRTPRPSALEANTGEFYNIPVLAPGSGTAAEATVELKMKETEEISDDDIDWFFEGDKFLKPEIPKLMDFPMPFNRVQDSAPQRKAECLRTIAAEPIGPPPPPEEDDEFDFELPNKTMCSIKSEQKSSSNISNSTLLDEDDEFSSCFDTDVTVSAAAGEEIYKDIKYHPETMMSKDTGSKNKGSIENKFNKLLQKVDLVSLKAGLNSSRHFRTIETIVNPNTITQETENLAAALDHSVITNNSAQKTGNNAFDLNIATHGNSNTSRLSELEKLLQTKALQSKVNSTKLLLNSRHFKTIESTVNSLNKNSTTNQCETGHIRETIATHGSLESGMTDCSIAPQNNFKPVKDVSNQQISQLLQGLCHGSEQVVDAACDVIQTQFNAHAQTMASFRIATSLIQTLAIQGRMEIKTIPGILINAKYPQLSILEQNKHRKILLINGDVTARFRHKGYKQEQTVKVISKLPVKSETVEWRERVWKMITDLKVTALLIHGTCDTDIEELCASRSIFVATRVPYKTLQTIEEHCNCPIATYVHLCNRRHVTDTIVMAPVSSDWADRWQSAKSELLVAIHLPQLPVTTTIFSHPVEAMSLLREEEFKHVIYRAKHSFARGCVLKGQGQTELHLATYLNELAEEREKGSGDFGDATHESEIQRAAASGLQRYALAVYKNNGHMITDQIRYEQQNESETNVGDRVSVHFDDFEAKTEAWSSACHLVCQIIQTDREIVNGLPPGELVL